ncbi:hypothetical protein [Actinophytocola sediminis]
MTARRRLCGHCLLATLAGVAWPMWGSRPEGWPRKVLCRSCTTRQRD